MDVQYWTYLLVGLSFMLYLGIAIYSRAASTKEYYTASGQVPSFVNAMATAADWMSAASFISMAGIISFEGLDGARYLMGWTGGFVLMALLLAPYLRKFNQSTVPDFVADRYYSKFARLIGVICAIFICFTYIAGQMRGVGIAFSKFLEVDITWGVIIGSGIVFFYSSMGGMKGITNTQVAQFCVMIFAYMVPAIFISIMLTNNPIPQLGFGSKLTGTDTHLLVKLDEMSRELGFAEYTSGVRPKIDMICITLALMIGTAGLPHVIVRFFTVENVSAARKSAGYTLFLIAIIYTTAPAIAAFARTNLLQTVSNATYTETPKWFKSWENAGLIAWVDKNNDGKILYTKGNAMSGRPDYKDEAHRGQNGERTFNNEITSNENELWIDKDIMVLANPEIANLPNWVIALVVAGGLAAALSTAAGLLLVISTSVSHDLLKKILAPNISDKQELLYARLASAAAVVIAAYFGINPPGFVASVVAFAFGLAASSFFPLIIMGVFFKKMNREGAVSGMIVGMVFTASYIFYFKLMNPELNIEENWLFGISPEGIGTVGAALNFLVAIIVCSFTPPPPEEVQEMVERIRIPNAAGASKGGH